MPAPQTDADLLTPADAARLLGLSVDMVRLLATKGQLATAAKTTRGARLFRRDDVEELAATRAGRHVRHHSVQFYETDEHLAVVVCGFLSDALRGGAPAIVIATEAHREKFVQQIKLREIDAAEALRSGQLVLLDARQTLALITVDGALNEARFQERMGSLMERSRRAWPRGRLRAYGEMVDLLWKDGQREASLALEEMWNRLAAKQPFSLLCSHEMSNFAGAGDTASFDRVCLTHSKVVPAESFHQDGGIDSRHREIARLQQRARALENELSERERTEHALRKAKEGLDAYSQQLAEALHAKDEILAILGHELRNPLAPMLTAIELLKLKGVESREHVIIARQVRHLHRLVEDLLDVGRLLRGKVQLERRLVAVREVISRAVDLASEDLAPRRADFQVFDHDVEIEVDLERMAQALSNLLRNAIQNSTSGTPIAIDVRRAGAEIVFSVKDKGEGIASDLLPRVFDLFAQHAQGLDRSHGGLGIGLAITKNIVHLHGGTVVARSEGIGQGSEFVVTLPLPQRTSVEPAQASESELKASLTRRRVLVVDDNEDAATMLAELLTECGHAVEVAYHADAAIDAALRFLPEFALLDIGLPEVDGYELARRLRSNHGALRLVAVSGYGDSANKARSAAAGFEAHLVKPVRLEDLLKLLVAQ